MRRVAIVGGGPAGLVLSHLLWRAGVDHVLLERRTLETVGGAPKAGSIDYRTVEMLQREGLSPAVVRFDAPNGVCEFRSPERRVVFDYGARTGGRPHFILPQHLLVAQLAEALVATGADVRWQTNVTGLVRHDDRVEVHTDAGVIEAEYVVGCDGARSAVAAGLPEIAWDRVEFPVRPQYRVHHPELDPEVRKQMFEEVEQTICAEDAYREARRCLRCYRVYSVVTAQPIPEGAA